MGRPLRSRQVIYLLMSMAKCGETVVKSGDVLKRDRRCFGAAMPASQLFLCVLFFTKIYILDRFTPG